MTLASVVSWIVFGLVIGALARFIMPGRQSMGILMTILLGIAGSFAGGSLYALFSQGAVTWRHPGGWILSLVGALILLFGYSMLQKR